MILGEAGKQEILQQMFRKFCISNRLPNRYFPKIDVGCPWYFIFLQAITNKTSSSKTIKISSDIVIKLGPDLLELMGMIVRVSQRKKKRKSEREFWQESESNWHHILLQFPVFIDSLASLLHIYSVSEQSRYSTHLFAPVPYSASIKESSPHLISAQFE